MELLNRLQAAEILGVSVATVDRLIKKGILPHRRIGGNIRFTAGDLEMFVDAAKIPAKGEA